MIRINLLDDIKIIEEFESFQSVPSTPMDLKQTVSLIIKFIFMLLPSLAVFQWNAIEKSSKQQTLDALKIQEQEILTQLAQQNQQYDKIKDLQKGKLELDQVIVSLSQAALKRTFVIESLEALHSVLPDQAWLTQIEVSKDNTIVFTGEAKPSAINVFVNNLDQQPKIYKNVNVVSSTNFQSSNENDYINFKISAELAIDQEIKTSEENTIDQDKSQEAKSIIDQEKSL